LGLHPGLKTTTLIINKYLIRYLIINNLRVNSEPHMDLSLDVVKSDVASDTFVAESRRLQIAGLL